MEFGDVDTGKCITLLVEPIVLDPSHDAHQLRIVHSGALCLYAGLLPAGCSRYTLCDVMVVRQFPVPMVCACQSTKILSHATPTWVDMLKMIDGCSGIGGISHGAQAVGIVTTVAVDSNALMTDLHSQHSGAEVITGDLGEISVITEVWRRADNAQILSAGFSCQPFSSLGDQRSGQDPRSASLPKALKAASYLQCKIVMLECVTPAGSDKFVAQCIDKFTSLTGFKKEQIDLHLHEIWPCRRSRTWWLLTHPSLGGVNLKPWMPIDNLPAVKCLIPYISRWDPRDEMALSLDDAEEWHLELMMVDIRDFYSPQKELLPLHCMRGDRNCDHARVDAVVLPFLKRGSRRKAFLDSLCNHVHPMRCHHACDTYILMKHLPLMVWTALWISVSMSDCHFQV